MPTVWIPKPSGHDTSDAARFGEVKYLFKDTDNVFNIDALYTTAKRVLERDYRDGDCYIPAGPAIMNAVAFLAMADVCDDLRVLMFHAREEKYVARVLHLDTVAVCDACHKSVPVDTLLHGECVDCRH